MLDVTCLQCALNLFHLRVVRLQQFERTGLGRCFEGIGLLLCSAHQLLPCLVDLHEDLRFLRQLNIGRGEDLLEVEPAALARYPFVDRLRQERQSLVPFINQLSNGIDVSRRLDRRHGHLDDEVNAPSTSLVRPT